uniref:non-specific serine/threonine protein kinase n=1 Tax=Fagus sylvatica TaxID=28930 RepID=A0A2N9I0E4_FAGSY
MDIAHLPLSSLVTLSFFFFFTILPPSYCIDDELFVQCGRTYDCGDIKNISFPFWGDDRSQYCGLPGFQLECHDGKYPIIRFEELEFRVLHINTFLHTMSIARLDLLNIDESLWSIQEELIVECKRNFKVPILRSAPINESEGGAPTLQKVLNQGFDVEYQRDWSLICSACEGSGGKCGSNFTRGFVCFCRDGLQSSVCRGPHHVIVNNCIP